MMMRQMTAAVLNSENNISIFHEVKTVIRNRMTHEKANGTREALFVSKNQILESYCMMSCPTRRIIDSNAVSSYCNNFNACSTLNIKVDRYEHPSASNNYCPQGFALMQDDKPSFMSLNRNKTVLR